MKALSDAVAALERGDDAAALEALLVAWRVTRHPRIANAIDVVSARLGKEGVPGKTVKARTEAWLALAGRASAPDIRTLLATPWPGKWQDALVIVNALVSLPHDPRIAMALARMVEETPWDSWNARAFWAPLVRHLAELCDVRTRPILEADVVRVKSRTWQDHTRPIVVSALSAVTHVDVAELTAADEAVVARFIGDVAIEKAQAQNEADLLAAIYAAPADDAPRAVFADWLIERGDPRGEFIALQLAGSATPAARKREAKLLEEHGAAFGGPLARFLSDKGRIFERGFLARARFTVERRRPGGLPSGVDDPAWATVHTLEVDSNVYRLAAELFAQPSLQHLRTIRLPEQVAVRLAPRPALEELWLEGLLTREQRAENVASQRLVAEGATFPNVRRLLLEGSLERVALFLDGAFGPRVEQLTVAQHETSVGEVVRFVEKLGLPALREIRVLDHIQDLGIDIWRITMRRDARGRFTVLHAVAHRAGRGVARACDLLDELASFEPHELTALSIDRGEPAYYDVDTIEEIEAALGRFPSLTRFASVEVPWERIAPLADESTVPLVITLIPSVPVAGARFDLLWRLVGDPPVSLVLDGYAVNGGPHTALGPDGPAVAKKLLARKRTSSLELYRAAARERSCLDIHATMIRISCALDPAPAAVAQYVAWLVRVCDELALERADIDFMEREADAWVRSPNARSLELFQISASWMWTVSPALDARIPFAELEKLPSLPGLEWLRTFRTRSTLGFVFGATPTAIPTAAQLDLFEASCAALERQP